MSEDRNLELTALVHALNARSSEMSEKLRAKIAADPTSTHIELLSDGVVKLAWLLDTQAALIAKLVEENATIQDNVQALVNRIEQE